MVTRGPHSWTGSRIRALTVFTQTCHMDESTVTLLASVFPQLHMLRLDVHTTSADGFAALTHLRELQSLHLHVAHSDMFGLPGVTEEMICAWQPASSTTRCQLRSEV